MIKKIVSTLSVITMLATPVTVLAAMSSTNYYIYADSIGVNGGNYSATGTYALQDTIGGSPAGISASSTYQARGGFQAMDNGTLSFSIDNQSLSLGTLSTNQVNTASTNLTVSADALGGYTVSVGEVSGHMIDAVADGSVTAGQEEFGVAGSGTDNQLSGDNPLNNGLVVAASSGPVANAVTTLTFKASMSSLTAAGNYSRSIAFIVSANF